jgi:hypothetical protein
LKFKALYCGNFFLEREHHRQRAEVLLDVVVADEIRHPAAGTQGEHVVGRVVVVQSQADLFEVVNALRSPGGFAGRLHGGQQQGDQDRNYRDDDEQFDQGETMTSHGRILLDVMWRGTKKPPTIPIWALTVSGQPSSKPIGQICLGRESDDVEANPGVEQMQYPGD